MSRGGAFAAIAAVVVLAGGLAFWALRSDETPAGDGGPRGGTATAQTGADSAHAGGPAAGRAKAAAPRQKPADEDDAHAVAGKVFTTDGADVAGASVEAFVVPDGTRDEAQEAAREALRGLIDDDSEIEAIASQFGGDTGTSPESVQKRIRATQRLGSRIASDPAAIGRIARLTTDFAAGLERDANLAPAGATTTGADGSFRIDGLGAGKVELRVTAPRFQRRKTRVAVGDAKVKVELAPAGTVEGEVRCEGVPVAGAEVRLRSRTLKTGPDGRFRYDGGRPPREPVIASAPGCVARGVWANVVLAGDPEPVVLDLEPAGRISGRVTSRDGAPVAGAVVEFAPDANGMMSLFMGGMGADKVPVPAPRAVSRDDGTYEMDGISARTVKFSAEHAGYLSATSASVTVTARGAVEHVDFVLARESVLEGRVTDPKGAPIADAEVKVEVPAEGMAKMMAQFMGGVTRQGRTGPDGAFRVVGLTDGARGVTVEAEGWLSAKETVTLGAQTSTRQDFTLKPGYRVSGRVVSPDGGPVPGATVGVTAKGGGSGNPMAAMFGGGGAQRSATTDETGAFVVTGLQDGPYEVTAEAPAFLPGTVAGVLPGAEDVVVSLGAAATIRGIVVSQADGTPVAGAQVRRKGKAQRGAGNPFMAAFARDPAVVSAADGTFAIEGIAPGAYEIWASAKGFADTAKLKVDAVAGATVGDLSLALPPGSSLAGRVLRKADGSAVAGAVVWVKTDATPFSFAPADITGGTPTAPTDAPNATTKDDGSFQIDGLTPGKVTLEVRAADFAPRTIAGTEVPGAATIVEMSAGGALEGIVFDKAGRPAEGRQVLIQQGMMGQGFVRTAATDRVGHYRIERIPPGSYTAMIIDPDSPMGMGGMGSVAIRDGETTTKDFGKRSAGSPVEGGVTADGKPVDGASVMLLGGSSGMQMVQTDAQGAFRFEHVDAGEYTLTVQRDAMGGGSESRKVTVGTGGEVVKVALQLSTLAVEGTVVDAETGKAVGFAQVVLLTPGAGGGGSLQDLVARQKGQAFTDDGGRFRMTGVPAGTFSLRVTATGFAEANVDNVVPGGGAVRVAMTRGVELAVTVLGPDAKPVAGASVIPEDASGKEALSFDFTMTKTTGADGVARLRMAPGRYVLHARATGFPDAIATVDAGAGAGAVTIRFEAGGTLEIVVRSGGAPVAGASVKLLDAAGAPITESMTMSNFLGTGGTTDESGRARREGLRAGKITVVVKTPAGKESRSEAVIAAGRVTTVEIAAD